MTGWVHEQLTAKRDMSVNGSGSSGGRTGDIDRAGKEDILAVAADPADLRVYSNKGYTSGNPLATYATPVVINHNWSSLRWVGQGRITPDYHPDVLAIDHAGNLSVHKHSGTFAGTGTLSGVQFVSAGWNDYDLVLVFDVDDDGRDDVIGLKSGTQDFFWFATTVGANGQIGQAAPVHIASFATDPKIVDAALADFSGDGVPDWVLRRQDGQVYVYDPTAFNGPRPKGRMYPLSFGWTGITAFTISDVNTDGDPDILGRVGGNGNLNLYLHTGVWKPAPTGTVFDTLAAPKVVSLQWNGVRIIT